MIERIGLKRLLACLAMASLLVEAGPAGAIDLFREYDPIPPVLTAPPVRTIPGLPYTDPDPPPAGTRLVLYKIGTLADPDPVFPAIRLTRSGTEVVIHGLVSGACCGGGLLCTDVDSQAACEALGHLWAGDGTSCSDTPFPCTALLGACCSLGLCEDGHVPLSCLGAFAGSGTRCADVPPPCSSPGACCTGNGQCLEGLTQAACEMNFGEWRSGAICLPNPCRGACCRTGGSCADLTPLTCYGQRAVYQGDGTSCGSPPAPCADFLGACCTSSGCVEDATETWCQQIALGRWLGARTPCPPTPPICR